MSDSVPAEGSPRFDRDRDLAELAGLETDMVEVAAALRRLDDGSYGTCEVCGVPIPAALEADPLARRCGEHREIRSATP